MSFPAQHRAKLRSTNPPERVNGEVNRQTEVVGVRRELCPGWSIGSTGDFSAYVTTAQLASFELDWSAAHIEAARAVLAGEWTPTNRWRGLGEGGFVRMTSASPELPASVSAEMADAQAAIVSGALNPYAGPILDQSGTERVAAGAALPDDDIKSMTWLVDGVDGALPNG